MVLNESIVTEIMCKLSFKDWSLITGRGWLQNGRGVHVKFYPYEKRGVEKV